MLKSDDTPSTVVRQHTIPDRAHIRELQAQLRNARHRPASGVWPVYKVIREAFADERAPHLKADFQRLYLSAYDALMSAPVRTSADASILLWYERDNAQGLRPDAATHVITWVREAA
jgi:hypothetical protein